MFKRLRNRWLIVVLALCTGLYWLSPNFVDYGENSEFAGKKLVLGLDIQGGLHLVMGVNVQEVLQERVLRLSKSLESELKDQGVNIQSVSVAGPGNTGLKINYSGESAEAAINSFLQERYPTTLQVVSSSGGEMELGFFEARTIEMKKQTVAQAIEVIRNRIDEFGVAEPSITAQGEDRILVQLPGIQDAAKAKELINRTARLDFRVVSAAKNIGEVETLIQEAEAKGNYRLGENDLGYAAYVKKVNEDLKDKLPPNTKVVFEKMDGAERLEDGKRPYLIETLSKLSGDQLEDASVGFDGQSGKPEVNFSFTPEGRRLFAEVTEKAAGGSIAIVLDDVIKSAPSVEQKIDSESARITLGATRDYQSTLDEATFIATALRAGALPAALEQLEERTVGPSLGADSIRKGQLATTVGAILVLIFMALYYRVAGVVADLTLTMNILLLFGVLSTLGATLTLPGVAGIALTIGMAVDANVIIFERIKEELRKGTSMSAAVRDGFGNAFSSIFDSNITTVLTCLVLMYYGTGPIRGFAVTLAVGITVSMFTAVFVSRTIMETLVNRMGINVMPAPKVEA